MRRLSGWSPTWITTMKYDDILSNETKQEIINDYCNNGLSYRDIMTKYSIKSRSYTQKLLKDVVRSTSEANKIAHKKYPEKFQHSEKTKEKIRQARLKYMKEHPEDTA